MAEDLIQRLGFDAGQAIQTINQLKTSLSGLNDALKGVGGEVKAWNASAGNASKIFKQIESAAKGAQSAISSLQMSTAGLASAAAGGTDLNSQLATIQQITSAWGKVPQTATAASRQAFQKAQTDLAGFAAANKLSAEQMAQAFSGTYPKAGQHAQALITKVKALQDAHAKMAGDVKQQAQLVTISWQSMVRGFATQVLYRAFSALVGVLQTGVTAAADFGQRLAEIGTITPGLMSGLQSGVISIQQANQLLAATEASIVRISSQTGQGLASTAEAYYETLSNQVGSASDSLYVFEQASKLALATNGNVIDSVNLLSSVLNSYGKSANSAAQISDVLFKAIEVGRFRAGDLADIIGRVTPLASEMGIAFEEVMSALTTMTVEGVRADTAVTQLRAVLNQLLKPTADLKKVMQEEWGVENAEQAIVKFGGLEGTLRALYEVAGNNKTRMNELFTNLRALTGVISTSRNGAQGLSQDLKALQDSMGLVSTATNFVVQSPAKQFQLAVNDMKIAATELGQQALPYLTTGVKLLTASLALLKPAIVLAMAALIGFTGAKVANIAASATLAGAWTGLTGVVTKLTAAILANPLFVAGAAGFLIGYGIGKAIDYIANSVDRTIKSLNEGRQAFVDFFRPKLAEETAQKIEAIDERISALTDSLKDASKAYQEVVKEAKRLNETTVSTAKQQLGDLVKVQEDIVAGLTDVIAKSEAAKTESLKRSATVQRGIEQKQFDWRLERYNESSQAFMRANRAQELAADAMSRARTGTPEDLEAAREIVQLAQQQAQQASSEASSINDVRQKRAMLMKTRQAEITAMQTLLQIEEQERAAAAKRAEEARKRLAAETQALNDMKTSVAAIVKGMALVDSEGKLKKGPEWEKDAKAAEKAWNDLIASMQSKDKMQFLKLSDMLGVAELANQFKAQAAKMPELRATLNMNVQEQHAMIQAQFDKFPVELKLAFDAADLELTAEGGVSDLIQGLTNIRQKFAKATEDAEKLRSRELEIGYAAQAMAEQISKAEVPMEATGDHAEALRTALGELKTLAANFSGGIVPLGVGSQAEESLRTFGTKLEEFKRLQEEKPVMLKIDTDTGSVDWAQKVKPVTDAMQQIISSQAAAISTTLDTIPRAVYAARGELEKMTAVMNVAERAVQTMTGATASVATSTASAETSMNNAATAAGRVQTSGASFAKSMSDSAATANRIKSTIESIRPPTIRAQTQALGGKIKRLASGGPVGTDRIPAWLSEGEYVMNAKATRRFYSQLVAMNAGVKPIYRQDGGPVTNIGDINVSVTGAQTSKQTARDIAAALRRELRRGSTTLS